MANGKTITFKTIAEAVKHFGGEANLLEALGSYATNMAARKVYNQEKNDLLKVAKELLKQGKITMPAKA
jgi:hypothetical protein